MGVPILSFKLTIEEALLLVKCSRRAVEEYLRTGVMIDPPANLPSTLMEPCGVFVTLNNVKNGGKKLRGCIGFPYPTIPLMQAVIETAINSATKDPRFHPISLWELDNLTFEVSVLSPPQLIKVRNPVEYLSKIQVGKDGLIVEKGFNKGLLLPQVAVEWGWDEEEFLCQCCIKAGLSPDSWLLKETKIYNFSCYIAFESKPRGEIKILGPNLKKH